MIEKRLRTQKEKPPIAMKFEHAINHLRRLCRLHRDNKKYKFSAFDRAAIESVVQHHTPVAEIDSRWEEFLGLNKSIHLLEDAKEPSQALPD